MNADEWVAIIVAIGFAVFVACIGILLVIAVVKG
jgi:hypothetical protein